MIVNHSLGHHGFYCCELERQFLDFQKMKDEFKEFSSK